MRVRVSVSNEALKKRASGCSVEIMCLREVQATGGMSPIHLDHADPVHEHELRRRLSHRLAATGLVSGLRCHNRQPRRSASDCEKSSNIKAQKKHKKRYVHQGLAQSKTYAKTALDHRQQGNANTKTKQNNRSTGALSLRLKKTEKEASVRLVHDLVRPVAKPAVTPKEFPHNSRYHSFSSK